MTTSTPSSPAFAVVNGTFTLVRGSGGGCSPVIASLLQSSGAAAAAAAAEREVPSGAVSCMYASARDVVDSLSPMVRYLEVPGGGGGGGDSVTGEGSYHLRASVAVPRHETARACICMMPSLRSLLPSSPSSHFPPPPAGAHYLSPEQLKLKSR